MPLVTEVKCDCGLVHQLHCFKTHSGLGFIIGFRTSGGLPTNEVECMHVAGTKPGERVIWKVGMQKPALLVAPMRFITVDKAIEEGWVHRHNGMLRGYVTA